MTREFLFSALHVFYLSIKNQNNKDKNSVKKLLAVYTEHLDESSRDKWNENLFPFSSLSKSE